MRVASPQVLQVMREESPRMLRQATPGPPGASYNILAPPPVAPPPPAMQQVRAHGKRLGSWYWGTIAVARCC